jgi:hypothetical protein
MAELNKSLARYQGRPGRQGKLNKTGQNWQRQVVVARLLAYDIDTREKVWINELGTAQCDECHEIPRVDPRGFQACRCTVWNDGVPRKRKKKGAPGMNYMPKKFFKACK